MATAKKNRDARNTAANKTPTILSVYPCVDNGKLLLFGLADNSKIYLWSSTNGLWIPNWNTPDARKPTIPAGSF